MVFNKLDLYREKHFDKYLDEETKDSILAELSENYENTYEHENIFISAISKENVNKLRKHLKGMIEKEYDVRYPHQRKFW